MRTLSAAIMISAALVLTLVVVSCSQEQTVKEAVVETVVEENPKPAQEAIAPETPKEVAILDQPTCPVMGNPISRALHTDYRGKRIYFCCPPCVKKFEDDPDRFMQVIEEKGMKLEDAPGGG